MEWMGNVMTHCQHELEETGESFNYVVSVKEYHCIKCREYLWIEEDLDKETFFNNVISGMLK